jgi:hypothetical protein
MTGVGQRLDGYCCLAYEGLPQTSQPLAPCEDWLGKLAARMSNIVQVAPPTSLISETAEQGLDLVFQRMLVDPVGGQESRASYRDPFKDLRP